MTVPRTHNIRILFFILLALCSQVAFAQCNHIWANWIKPGTKSELRGKLNLHIGEVDVSVRSESALSLTSKIYNYEMFDTAYDKPLNVLAGSTTWSADSLTASFSTLIYAPTLLLSSLGSPGKKITLRFSQPYIVYYVGTGCSFINDSVLTGEDGYCIIMFPGYYKSVSVYPSAPDDFTHFSWGVKNTIPTYFYSRQNCKGEVDLIFSGSIPSPFKLDKIEWNLGDGGTYSTDSSNHTIRRAYAPGIYGISIKITSSEPCPYYMYMPIVVGRDTLIENPQNICKDSGYTINNHTYYSNGTYYDTYTGIYGCDSTIVTRISVFPDTLNTTVRRCETEGYTFPDSTWTNKPGEYRINRISPKGCRYLEIMDLRILPDKKTSTRVTHASCYGSRDGTIGLFIDPTTGIAPFKYTLNGKTQNINVFTGLTAGIYTYNISDASERCPSEGKIQVTQPAKIVIDVYPNNIIVPVGTEVKLKASGNYSETKYKWNVQLPPDKCDSCEELTVTPENDTHYPISASVRINNKVCTVDSFASIRVFPIVYAPTAFTPNNDGLNDYFSIEGLGLNNTSMFEVSIYNQWGELLYHNFDPHFRWDGTYEQAPAPGGVYVCVIRHRAQNRTINQPDIYLNVTLLR